MASPGDVFQLNTPLKQKIACLVLLGLFLWPIAHHLLVLKYDISPWRFGGFAMYCVPRRIVDITLHHSDRSEIKLSPGSAGERVIWKYGREWVTWGPHQPQESFWRELRAATNVEEPLVVFVREIRLDRETSRTQQTGRAYPSP